MSAKIQIDTYNLDKIEEQVIRQCLADNSHRTVHGVAYLLNISPRTLYRKINKYKINLRTL